MQKAKSSQEYWLSLNHLSKQFNLSRKLLTYYAVKFRLRTFKWHGVRYIEFSHAKCLLESRGISQEQIQEILGDF